MLMEMTGSIRSLSTQPFETVQNDKNLPNSKLNLQSNEIVIPKKSLKEKAIEICKHYYNGLKLLAYEVKISSSLLIKTVKSDNKLTRRERKQLIRTLADVLKMFPYLFFIIIPMLEFLLPLYLKFFPFMLPSTFNTEENRNRKLKKSLNQKVEIASIFKETLDAIRDSPSITELQEKSPSKEDLKKYSLKDLQSYLKNFEDEITFDKLDKTHIEQLCKLLSLPHKGPLSFLRFQLRLKAKMIEKDDLVGI
ncbi:MAG: letm1 and EF-hand domain-containing protein 1, mitochondrial [Paramarteilia canceri]